MYRSMLNEPAIFKPFQFTRNISLNHSSGICYDINIFLSLSKITYVGKTFHGL